MMTNRLQVEIDESLKRINNKLIGNLPEFKLPTSTHASGQSPSSATPEDTPLTNLERARYPIIVSTDSYLNDPIQFQVSKNFYTDVIPMQLPEGSEEFERDVASFVTVEINKPEDEVKKYHMISSFSDIYNRTDFYKTINVEFEEFGIDA